MFDQAPLAIEPRTDIYGPLLPHGASFQRLQTYRQLSAEACIADIASGNTREWFRRDLPDTLLRVIRPCGMPPSTHCRPAYPITRYFPLR